MSNKNSSNEKTTKDGNEENLNEPKNDFNLKNLKEYETIKIVDNKNNPEKENKTLQIKKNNLNKKKPMLNSTYAFLNYIGKSDEAKKHRYANIPLKKVGEKNKDTKYCSCCGLPVQQDGYLEKYNYCDSTEEFATNGQAISLYFSFYIYSIFILIIAFILISLPSLIISYKRSDELNKICNEIYENIKIEECKIYLNKSHNIEDENKSRFNFIVDFSGLNIKNYRIIHAILTGNENNDYDKIFVNYNILNFMGIWTILLIYFGYLILMYNKKLIPGIDFVSPEIFSIIITGMEGFYSFLRTKTNYLSIIKENENDVKKNIKEDMKESSERELIDEKSVSGVKRFENIFKEKLSEIFFSDKKKYDIKKVNVCFKINKYIELQEKLEECEDMENLIHLPYQKNKNLGIDKSKRIYYYSPLNEFNVHFCERTKKLSDIKKEKSEIQKQINELLQEIEEINMEKFAGALIVSFNTIKEKEEFMSHIPNSLFIKLLKIIGKLRYFFCFCCIDKIDNSKFVMKNLKINIEDAPNPEDIIFENLEFTQQSKVYRVVGINMISLLLIAIGFGIILGFKQLQIIVNKKDYNQIILYIISLCIAIVCSIINIIFEEILDMLTKQEKQSSITNYYLSYSIKLTIFTFLVKGVIPLVVEEILGTPDYEILITNMLTIFLVNSIITPLLWAINPKYLIKKIQIHLIETSPSKYLNMNQKKLNEIYEKIDMKIAEKYSYIAQTLLMTFLYISIFPFGVLISLGGFIFCFLLEKYNFINNYKRPEILNNTLFYFYLENFIIIIFFIGIGDYVFLKDVFSSRAWSLVNIIFLGILIVIPYNYFLNQDFIGFKESNINIITYDEAYLDDNFKDYERCNPFRINEGLKNRTEKLYETEKIDKEKRDSILKDNETKNPIEAYFLQRKERNNQKIKKSLALQEKKNLLKSIHPNQKKFLKLTSICSSFININKNENPKTSIIQNPGVKNDSNKEGNDILSINNNIDKNAYKKKDSNLNKIEEIKEENIIDEDDKESKFQNNNAKKQKKQKNIEIKSDQYKNGKTFNMEERYKEFYNDPIVSNIYGSLRVYNFYKDLFEFDKVSEDESLIFEDNNINNNDENLKKNDNDKKSENK